MGLIPMQIEGDGDQAIGRGVIQIRLRLHYAYGYDCAQIAYLEREDYGFQTTAEDIATTLSMFPVPDPTPVDPIWFNGDS